MLANTDRNLQEAGIVSGVSYM